MSERLNSSISWKTLSIIVGFIVILSTVAVFSFYPMSEGTRFEERIKNNAAEIENIRTDIKKMNSDINSGFNDLKDIIRQK